MNKKTIIKIVITLTTSLLLFLCYVIYYYGNISFLNIIKHLVVSVNIFIKIFLDIVNSISINENLLKILLIGLIVFLVLKYVKFTNILSILENLNIELPNVKVSMSKLKERVEATEALIERTDSNNNLDTPNMDTEEQLIKEKELMEALIDNSYLAKILNSFLLGKRNIKIPMRLISTSIVKIDDIKKIFEYEISSNSIKIIKLKERYNSVAPKVYTDLVRANIIVQA